MRISASSSLLIIMPLFSQMKTYLSLGPCFRPIKTSLQPLHPSSISGIISSICYKISGLHCHEKSVLNSKKIMFGNNVAYVHDSVEFIYSCSEFHYNIFVSLSLASLLISQSLYISFSLPSLVATSHQVHAGVHC